MPLRDNSASPGRDKNRQVRTVLELGRLKIRNKGAVPCAVMSNAGLVPTYAIVRTYDTLSFVIALTEADGASAVQIAHVWEIVGKFSCSIDLK